MTNDAESNISTSSPPSGESRGGLLKLGAFAVGSALLGGIAVAWWYRKTVRKLHETGENNDNPHFGIDSNNASDESVEEL